MFELAKRLPHRDALVMHRKALCEALSEFYETNYEQFEGRYTNRSNIKDRNRLFGDFLDQFVQ